MNTIQKCYTISALAIFITAGNVSAQTFTFEDEWIDWANDSNYYTGLGDEHGTPEINQLVVTTNDDFTKLTKVEINLRSPVRQTFDSLFINTSYTSSLDWDAWTYFVHDGGINNSTGVTGTIPQQDGLYSVADDYTYTLSASSSTVRSENPNGIDAGDLTLINDLFEPSFANSTITYDFGDGLALNGGFFVAYSPFCANDVIGGGTQAPVPEPTTMLLFGTGLAGLAGINRRKKK